MEGTGAARPAAGVTPVRVVRIAGTWDNAELRAACAGIAERIAGQPADAAIWRGRNTLTRLELGGRQVVAKAFPPPRNLLKRMQRIGRASKAVRAFDHAAEMQRRGIGTPTPWAAIESDDGAAWYLCDWLADCRPAWHLHDGKIPDGDRWCDELGAFMGRMHEAGAYHYDNTPGNILLHPAGEGWEFLVVDCNRMRFGAVGRWAGLRSLAQLQCQGRLLAGYCRARGWDLESTRRIYDLRLALHKATWGLKDGTRPLRRRLGF